MQPFRPILTAALFAPFAFATVGAWAQETSRAAVKAETKAAVESGATVPPGPRSLGSARPEAGKPTLRSRSDRKAETAAAVEAGATVPPGQRGIGSANPPAGGASGTTSRAARKAETKAANEAGRLRPPGPGGE
jgi:hypothetical protein